MSIDQNQVQQIRSLHSLMWHDVQNKHLIDRILNGSLNMAPETVIALDSKGLSYEDICLLNGIIGERFLALPKTTQNRLDEITSRTGIDFKTCDKQAGLLPDEVRILHCCILIYEGKRMETFTLLRLDQAQLAA